MPNYELGGPMTPFNSLPMTASRLSAVGYNWYLNLLPLLTRLPKGVSDAPSYKFASDTPRPKSVPTGASVVDGAVTTVTVTDATNFDVDDVIQIENEYLLISAINTGTNVLTVARGIAGTTAAAHTTISTPVYLVTNTRTGAAINIPARRKLLTPFEQWNQTIQHAYMVGGADATNAAFVSPQGSPLDRDRFTALTDVMVDAEKALVYGRKVANTSPTSKPQMAGISQLLVTNNVVGPTNAATYKPTDLMRDTFQRCADNGGNPTVFFCSTDFLTGLAVWGMANMPVDVGASEFGVAIQAFRVPFLTGAIFIPAPHLRTGTVIALNPAEVKVNIKRNLRDKPRGSNGDAEEGDIIWEGSIQVDNESHHAMVQGITAFAAP